MRFNKDTERGICIDEIAEQCRTAVATATPVREFQVQLPKVLWDCRNGGWTVVNV